MAAKRFTHSQTKPPAGAVDGSVTVWIHALKAGEKDALERLWERYGGRLLGMARQRLAHLPSRAVDGEDVALSAFRRFCKAAEEGRLVSLGNRDELWRLLLKITLDRVVDIQRRESAQRRGGGQLVSIDDSAFSRPDPVDGEPSPEMATILADRFYHLMTVLDDDELRQIALMKLDGYSNKDLAAFLGVVERTVERRLKLIRKIWQEHGVDGR